MTLLHSTTRMVKKMNVPCAYTSMKTGVITFTVATAPIDTRGEENAEML